MYQCLCVYVLVISMLVRSWMTKKCKNVKSADITIPRSLLIRCNFATNVWLNPICSDSDDFGGGGGGGAASAAFYNLEIIIHSLR